MGGIEQNKTQEQNVIEAEKKLKNITDIVENKDDFEDLIKWYENQETIKDIKNVPWMQEAIDKYIKAQPWLLNIFDKEYKEDQIHQDLYEVCVLWAILNKGDKIIDITNYQKIAKDYYESINPPTEGEENKEKEVTPEIKEEEKPNITGTYETAEAKMGEQTIVEVNNITKEEWKIITEASITISAGADQRKMNETKAKAEYDTKITALEDLGKTFTNNKNKEQINTIITELRDPKKIQEISKDKKENQEGNRYLIGARIAEWFLKSLENLKTTPEPALTLKINRDKCLIGNEDKDLADDRFIKISLKSSKIDKNIDDKTDEEKELTEQQKGIIKEYNLIEDEDWWYSKTWWEWNIYFDENGDTYYKGKEMVGSKYDYTKKQRIAIDEYPEEIKEQINKQINKEGKKKKIPEWDDGKKKPAEETTVEKKETSERSPDIFIAERIKIALSKDFKRNGKPIDKDKDIQKIGTTKDNNIFNITIDNKDILFSCKKIDKDWSFEKDEKGNVKIKEEDKKYYETKLETTQVQDKFKVYDVKETNKNINTTLNEEKTKEAFKTYYTFSDTGYSLDGNSINVIKSTTGDLESIKANIKFTIPKTILDNQTDKNTKEDMIENIVFDKNGEIKLGNWITYEKTTGKNKFSLLTKETDTNGNYKKENKNINYNIKTADKKITIINDEIQIGTNSLADRKDNRMASEVENANKTQETFKEYATDLNNNFQKRQINALGADKYQLLAIPKIAGVDESQYITIPFSYKYNSNNQTKSFSFDKDKISIPEKNKDGDYFVIKNIYYKIDISRGEQISINPKIVLDEGKTKTEAIKKTNIQNNNQIKEPTIEKVANNKWWLQNRNISLLNNINYNSANYLDFSLDEKNQEIKYTREISLDEVLWYDTKNEKKLILGTINFDGKWEIQETKDRNLTINKKNQTLEINDIFGRNKKLTIPFEMKNGMFNIGTISNPEANYITKEFTNQKEYLKNRIYNEKSTITNKINEQIKKIGTPRANEFPWLSLSVPKEGPRNMSNTETINALQYLKGPTSTGLYYLQLDNEYKQGKNERPEEFLYFKIIGDEVKLTDMNGKDIEETYIQSNKEYKPGKGLIKIEKDLSITTIRDITEQEKGYPIFNNEPEILKTYLTKTVDTAKPTNYDKEKSGQYLRIFWNSRIGHITSLPIKTEENNTNKYLYNKEGLKPITSDDMAKDLRDYDKFGNTSTLGLNEIELKEIFVNKYKANENIDKATRGDNIRIKNSNGKYEYWNISSSSDGEKIKFEENNISKEIQEKVIDNIKKDLAIIGSVENIKFKYRRNDEKRKTLTDWNKAGNRTIKDIEKQTIKDFINQEKGEDKKISLKLLGPARENITLNINNNIYKNLEAKELGKNGYYKDIFETKLADKEDKELNVQNEKYKVHIESDKQNKENRMIFESQVAKGK